MSASADEPASPPVRLPGPLGRLEAALAWLLAPLAWLAAGPRRASTAAVALAVLPFGIHHEVEFKADDYLLIARGVETGILDGLVRNFTRPFCDTWTIEFYRPLFTWSFCLEGHLFGDRAAAYFIVNVAWHALATLAGYHLLRRLIGPSSALLATVLFASNPWAANNVSWIVGRCNVVGSLCMWLGAWLYLRYADRGRRGWPIGAIIAAAFGVFFRETALFLPVLVFLVDLTEGRRDRRAFRDWVLLTAPFVVYLLCKYAVLGTFIGGYARYDALVGERYFPPTWSETLAKTGNAVLDLIAPGSGSIAVDYDFGPLRIASLVLVGALVAVGVWGRGMRPRTWAALAGFVVLHAALLLAVDREVHGGTAQRWYTVIWAIAGLYALLAQRARLPQLAAVLVLGLAGIGFFRLHENLEDYEASARFTKEMRRLIDQAPEDLVFVYNARYVDRAAPFFNVGLGQTALPPFGSGKKAVYPLFAEARYGPLVVDETPIASWLLARGERLTAIWLDVPGRTARYIPPQRLELGVQKLAALPRLDVVEPAATILHDVRDLRVRVRADGLERLDIHVVCPLTEVLFQRYRGLAYPDGAGFRESEGGIEFVEDIRPLLESATLLDGAARGRCWLWLVGYDRATDPRGLEPHAVSEFYELHVTIPQERPTSR